MAKAKHKIKGDLNFLFYSPRCVAFPAIESTALPIELVVVMKILSNN